MSTSNPSPPHAMTPLQTACHHAIAALMGGFMNLGLDPLKAYKELAIEKAILRRNLTRKVSETVLHDIDAEADAVAKYCERRVDEEGKGRALS